MSKPIIDKAEVSIDFPDKYYHGSFGRDCRFDVSADELGAHINLDRSGEEKRHVAFHLHYHLLADIIDALGPALASTDIPAHEVELLRKASQKLDRSLGKRGESRPK